MGSITGSKRTMKLLVVAFSAVVLVPHAFAQAPSRSSTSDLPKKDECSIAGIVVKLAGSEPLKAARIRLRSADNRTRAVTTVTDGGGRFELKGIAPGRYHLGVSKIGFVDQEYGQRKPSDPGAILTLRASRDVKDLLFRLIPSAVIAGRILDEEGKPLPWVQVSALREVYSSGKRDLSIETTVPTNDLGEYRLFGLRPGRYFIRAEYEPNEHLIGQHQIERETDEEQRGYVPMYYPGSFDPARATAMSVRAGEEIPSVEILLQPVPTFSVRGRIFNLVSRRSDTYTVSLAPRQAEQWLTLPQRDAFTDGPDDSYVIRDVLPGSYTLRVFWSEEGKTYQAVQSVDVGNADVVGANLVIVSGMTVSGRIIWDGKPSLEHDPLTIVLRAADGTYAGSHARATATGTFALNNVFDGRYRLNVVGQTQDCYLKAVQYGSIDGLADGFTVLRGTNSTLEVTISSKSARVQGTVVDADNLPAIGVWVILVPDDAHRNQHRLYKQSTTDQYGRFDIHGVAPGEYKLFSWEEVEEGAWQDPEFLKAFEDKGESVEFKDLDLKTANLVAIRASADTPKP